MGTGDLSRHGVKARDGTQLGAFSAGDPRRPAVALVNGYGIRAEMMVPLASRLAADHRVITWDTRWVPALSDAFDPGQCGSGVHADDLMAILDHLGVAAADIVGWSSGAQIALRAMAEHPGRIQGGALLNPVVSLPDPVPRTDFERSLRRMLPLVSADRRVAQRYCRLAFDTQVIGGEAQRAVSSALTISDPHLSHLASAPFRTPESLYRYAHMLSAMFRERPDAWAGAVRQPVLVIGCGEDRISSTDIARALAAELGAGELHLDERGDHYSHFHDPDVARRIHRFLERRRANRSEVEHT